MDNNRLFVTQQPIPEQEKESSPVIFRCPDCMMGDTCSDCSMYGSDGYCKKFGGYTDPNKWACSWYYSH